MKYLMYILMCLLLVGCGKRQASPKKFERVMNNPKFVEIVPEANTFFEVGEHVDRYYKVLEGANEIKPQENETWYYFWMQGKDPAVDGLGFVFVIVDNNSKTIKSVEHGLIPR